MKIKDHVIIALLIGLYFSMALGFASYPPEKLLKEAWLDGYNKYISDYYIPAPNLPEQKESIPVKRPNPDLKEKFKG